jgi:hypothetical protein
MEMAKPTLCWTLNSMAAGLAQSLGYHRANSLSDDPEERYTRRYAFWGIYICDKGLSLRLGRASSIQDYDLSLQLPETEGNDQLPIFLTLRRFWVLTASIQGRIYEQLYSATALTSSAEERANKALRLAEEMEAIMHQYSRVSLRGIWVFHR